MDLDMRTIYLSYVISFVICTGVMALIWQQSRRRWEGPGWWLAGFGAHFAALVLIVLRGAVPDILSIVVGPVLLVVSMLLLYEGLGRFLQQRVDQAHNLILLVAFAAFQLYFTLAQPNLAAREINISAVLLIVFAQSAWLTLRRVEPGWPTLRWLGLICVGYCLISLIRIASTLALPPGSDFFAESRPFDAWVAITYQMLSIALTLGLVMLVNRRLARDLQIQAEALRISEAKFSKAFHASPDAILITHPSDGRIIEVNEGFCRITGYAREEALSSSILALHLWANPEQRAEYLAALQAHQSVRDYEYDFIVKSGARLTCLCSSETIYLENEAHVLSVIRDFTAIRQAEAALRESEARLRAIGDNLSAGQIYQMVVLPDGTSRFTYLSNAVEQLHECTAAQALADPSLLFNRVVEEDREGMQLAMEKSFREMSIYDHEVRIRRKSGEIRWHRHISKPRRGSDGETIFDGLDMDITEHRRAREERERLIEELDAFAHTVAHDLKNPLSVVISYAELLEADVETLLTAEQQQPLSSLIWMSRKMANIIDELLLMASTRGGRVEVQPLPMARIVTESLQRLAFLRQEYQAQIDVPPDWPTSLGYAPWVEEVWVNYLSNAIQYGGRPPRVKVGADVLPDGMVRFWVRDNGPGIAAEDLEQLFARLGQEHRQHARGHGLGLSIVKRIVDRLGGGVGVESVVGQGSLFYFTLPPAEGDA